MRRKENQSTARNFMWKTGNTCGPWACLPVNWRNVRINPDIYLHVSCNRSTLAASWDAELCMSEVSGAGACQHALMPKVSTQRTGKSEQALLSPLQMAQALAETVTSSVKNMKKIVLKKEILWLRKTFIVELKVLPQFSWISEICNFKFWGQHSSFPYWGQHISI